MTDALNQEPETLVRVDVPQPGGGLRQYTAWTGGGEQLGDHIDRITLAAGLDAWSWIQILERQVRIIHRGRIDIRTHPLRRVLTDVEQGYRGDETLRTNLVHALAAEAARCNLPPLAAPPAPAVRTRPSGDNCRPLPRSWRSLTRSVPR
ncbi:hypothetical protein [Streptomyces lincolnensis]|uniref:hypothetical protein n=1 Tax=Streptomyces lincolnensis TaxID=1915 RepID=UPI0037CF9C8A